MKLFFLAAVLVGLPLVVGCGGTEMDPAPGEQESLVQTEQATFNPCVCIDLSQVTSCSGSTCHDYCRSGTTTNWCSEQGRYVTCPRYVACSYCRIAGYTPSGLPCCSGRMRYNGNGTLVCA